MQTHMSSYIQIPMAYRRYIRMHAYYYGQQERRIIPWQYVLYDIIYIYHINIVIYNIIWINMD